MKIQIFFLSVLIFLISCNSVQKETEKNRQVSGIYPHLAYYNNERECGTGAVVPWADRLVGNHLRSPSSIRVF
jgi:hypothetical protein